MGINFSIAALIYLRLTGFIFLNDITGRKSIPSIVKLGLSLVLTICFANIYIGTQVELIHGFGSFAILGIKEVLIGFILAFIVNLVLSIIVIGGEMVDFHIGLSIAKIYDAQTNISMPISASLINVLFFVFFFFVNGHLNLIAILNASFEILPLSTADIPPDVFYNLCQMFSQILLLALKIAQVVIAIMLMVEIGIAVIMKAIPQINIFTINIQFKILLGLILLLFLMPLLTDFMDKMVVFLFDNLYLALGQMAKV